jgi:hypothetical protein
MRQGYELGLAAGRPWTYCLDADVLLRDNAIAKLIAEAETGDRAAFCFEGRVFDKLLGHERFCGNHLYRTRLLGDALSYGHFDARALRPERAVKDWMANNGHPTVIATTNVGIHDFEQAYVDLYRKASLHRLKFAEHLTVYAKDYWIRAAAVDPDFRVALAALANTETAPSPTDRRSYPQTIATLRQQPDLAWLTDEKPPIAESTARIQVPASPANEYARWRTIQRLGLDHRLERVRGKPFQRMFLEGAKTIALVAARFDSAREKRMSDRTSHD